MREPVTVIGAGIVGICCALSLVNRGIKVRIIEKAEPGQATSFGNAGVISPWSFIPMAVPGIWKKIPGMLTGPDQALKVRSSFWPKMLPWGLQFINCSDEQSVRSGAEGMAYLCQPSIELYRQHLEGTGHHSLIADSYYVHAYRGDSTPSLNALDYRIRKEKGADLSLLDATELQHLEPALSPQFHSAIVIKNQARALEPGKLATVLMKKAISLGVELENSAVRSLQANDNGWEIVTTTNNFQAPQVIMTAGAWSAKLLKPLGVSLPLVAERGYHVEVPDANVQLNNSILDTKAKLVASSMNGGVRLAGAADFAYLDQPEDKKRHTLLTQQIQSMFPDLKITNTKFWMGQRPSFPDSLPLIGPIKGRKGLYGAFGHSHHGLMMAPKTGETIADLLTGITPDTNLALFASDRF